MLRSLAYFIVFAAMLAGFGSSAVAEKRIALVIGNSAYEHTQQLPNPRNDALAIAKSLRRIGFDNVTLKLDLGYFAMRRAVQEFGRESKGADVALVFFAGHGLEVDGENYLVPTDAKLASDDDLEFEAVKLNTVLRRVRSASKLRLVILDACRNNPLGAKMRLSQGVTRSVSRGFSRIEPTGDVLVAYAAKHGTVAEDGDGTNSPYTTALLKHLETPGLEINFLFREVRDSVRNATGYRQDPFIYGSLGREAVYLVPPSGKGRVAPSDRMAALEQELAALKAGKYKDGELKSKERTFWNLIKEDDDIALFETYLKRYPSGEFRALAEKRIKQGYEARAMEIYLEMAKSRKGEEEIRARHILIASESEARTLHAQLKRGADFAKLARENSTGPSASRGGDLGYFTRGRMVKPFETAAFALGKGEFSGPVKTQFGWHLIKVEDKRRKRLQPFEQLKAGIIKNMKNWSR